MVDILTIYYTKSNNNYFLFECISSNFCVFVRCLMRYSSADACDLFSKDCDRTSCTGLLDLVYFAPRGDVLCSDILLSRSVVMPV